MVSAMVSKGARRRQRRQASNPAPSAPREDTPGDRYARERRVFLDAHLLRGQDAQDVWHGSMVEAGQTTPLGGSVLKAAFVVYLEGRETRDEPDRDRATRTLDSLYRENHDAYAALEHTIGREEAQADAADALGCSVATLQIRLRLGRALIRGIEMGLAMGDDERANDCRVAAADAESAEGGENYHAHM